jgi:AMMECR1 domain-containing protein
MRLVCLSLALLLIAMPLAADGYPSVSVHAELNDPDAQRYTLALARRAFDTYTLTRKIIDTPSPIPDFLKERSGVFVSTMRWGAPRTCMGTLYPEQADLADEIIENAAASAGRDRRFPPVRPGELKELNLIVSVVGEPHPISESQAVELDPVTEGLAVKCGDRYGVVLSGETSDPAKMIAWGKTRAGAKPGDSVSYSEIHDLRFMESEYLK